MHIGDKGVSQLNVLHVVLIISMLLAVCTYVICANIITYAAITFVINMLIIVYECNELHVFHARVNYTLLLCFPEPQK